MRKQSGNSKRSGSVKSILNRSASIESFTVEEQRRIRWIRLTVTISIFIITSLGLAYLLQRLFTAFELPLYRLAWLAYLLVFGISIATNLTVIVPVPLALSVMIAAATEWNPFIIALVGSIGGSIGELSGYYAGYLGKKIAIPESHEAYHLFEGWIKRYGVWAIALAALQPVVPFDIGGFIAGAARMPVYKFLPALWLGKFPKYLLLTYAGIGLIKYLPSWFR